MPPTASSPPPALPPSTAVVIPARDCADALQRVLAALPPDAHVFVVDDGSRPALHVPRGRLLRHPRNRGYGAAQKTGFSAAIDAGFHRLVLLHGDDQYDPGDTLALAHALDGADAVIGSRFLDPTPRGLPPWRRYGIQALTALANRRYRTGFTDLHNGARAYWAGLLRRIPYQAFSDDYHFDHQLLSALLARRHLLVERPVAMHYGPDVGSISFPRAVRYGMSCVLDLFRTPGA